jgi:hypothetical protein
MMNRRDALKLGGLAMATACSGGLVWPLNATAAGKAQPRSTAKNCILVEMGGAISQADCWDFKETKYTPNDLDVVKLTSDIYLSKTLFPKMDEYMQHVSLVRSVRANELVHAIGQYHTQTGRALNVALAREIPALGCVIASELESRRKDTDRFPTYVSTYLTQARCGAIGSGFLPVRFTGLDLDPKTVFDSFGGNSDTRNQLLSERWNLLEELAKVSEKERDSLGKKASDFKTFYADARRLEDDPRWTKVFQAPDEEKNRFGNDEFGLGCILARNLIAARGGTRFVYIYDGDRWDQHSFIFDRSKALNHYVNCVRFDKGMSNLIKDLASMPGEDPGKTLLDETLIVATSEFGRTPAMNPVKGRDHYRFVYSQFFAGGGVKGGRAIGKTDEMAANCVETGWTHKPQPYMDNAVATIYSALGIDWSKSIKNTPSGRAYEYIQTAPLGGGEFINNDEIGPLFA